MLLKYHFQDKYKISNKTMDSVAMAACAAMAVADFFIGYYLGFLLMSAAVVYMGYGYYKAERKEKAQ
jgi:hypothetical protein